MDDREHLSDEEMAALLDLIDGQRTTTEGRADPFLKSPCDERMRLRCAEAARAVGTTLAETLRVTLHGELTNLEARRLGPFLERLPDPCLLYPLGELDRPHAILEVDVVFAHAIFERLLGGKPNASRNAKRPDATVLQLIRPTIVAAAKAFTRDLAPWLPEAADGESPFGTACLSVAPFTDLEPQTPIHVLEVSLQGDLPEATLRLVLVGDVFTRPGSSRRAGKEPSESTRRAVNAVPVDVRAILGRARLSLRNLVDLEVGDVLRLPTRIEEPLSVEIQDEPRFQASLGQRHGRYAVRLEAPLPSRNPADDERKNTHG